MAVELNKCPPAAVTAAGGDTGGRNAAYVSHISHMFHVRYVPSVVKHSAHWPTNLGRIWLSCDVRKRRAWA